MYGVVAPGLIFAEHVFEGLRRDMYVRDDKTADKHKLAVTWAAKRDAELVGDKFSPTLRFVEASPGRVFVVYISINEELLRIIFKDYRSAGDVKIELAA